MPEPLDQIECLKGEEMGWFLENGCMVCMMVGIQDRDRADAISRFFLTNGNCEVSTASLDNGLLIKVVFHEK